jgi:hypothetical protein
VGLSQQDLTELEVLRNPEIVRRAGIDRDGDGYRCAYNVVRYMLAWADMIDEALGPRPEVPVEVVPQPAVVHS